MDLSLPLNIMSNALDLPLEPDDVALVEGGVGG